MNSLSKSHAGPTPRLSRSSIWLISFIALSLVAVAFLELVHSGWVMDQCDRPSANPRTPGSYVLISASIVVPFLLAVSSRNRALLVTGSVVAVLSAILWAWLTSPIPC